ncbi:MAG: YcaO-like family protein [Actinomycetota bacterium]|nr:YcaO-like family protein [Actinomycetota bacterium]
MAPSPTGGNLWTVAVDVGLGGARAKAGGGGPGLELVGACGFRRLETMVRAAGEAVERLALVPGERDPARILAVPSDHERRVHVGVPGVARTAELVDRNPVDCLPAADLSPGAQRRTVLLPAAVVDDPVDERLREWVDPSPSAAAAGTSWTYASMRALLESIERDAVQSAWALKPALPCLDPAEPPADWRVGKSGRVLDSVAEALADDPALTARTLLLPTGVPGVSCALTVLFDRGGPTAAGSAADWSVASAVATSAREALQVMVVLRNLGPAQHRLDRTDVVDEISRAQYWAEPSSAAEPLRWLEHGLAYEGPGPAETPPPRSEEARLEHLASHLANEGLTPLICDLTARLPPAIRALGWVAVRAIVLGHQALRMDERHRWSWAQFRLRSAAAKFGLPPVVALLSSVDGEGPHPLI